ncbi:ribonuclease 3-like protein 2 [Populus nigra]|uniref:ribonuclease 3-like protein 2 n=1 Tax=Populus nigra TaxID=3691 RepID=UPI002B266B4E|nr:ribonuclease 3-like protein 2 [Populus nigra]XP_061984593.1 ribonuclease 3-like protein 2 [Populus nigra]
MEASVFAVEKILNYKFKNKRLLEEALTHSSYTDSASYQRMEFLGDAALGLALSNYVYLAYPQLDPGHLSLLRAANISTEKLARVAIKHGLYRFVRHNATALDDKVKEFSDAVSGEDDDDALVYGGSIKAPKILADIVESVAAAVYVDVDFDLQTFWVIFRGILEPIVTLEDLQQQPQPVTMLFERCQKQGRNVDIKHWKNEAKSIASVYVDGQFIASSSSEQKEIAKLNAAKGALLKLSNSFPTNLNNVSLLDIFDGSSFEIEGAKQKLHELCGKKKWPKPNYNIENDMGPPHEKKFVCSVQIATVDGILYVTGDERTRVKDAENSAASSMIRALQDTDYL